MSKRHADSELEGKKSLLRTSLEDSPSSKVATNGEMGEMEDLEGNESDDEVHQIGSDIDDDEDDDADMVEDGGRRKALQAIKEDEDAHGDTPVRAQRVYIPTLSAPLEPGETMEPDMSAYKMLHSFNVEFPSLSFDIIEDHLGDVRNSYPQTSYLVTGTQAKRARDNHINVIKVDQMVKTYIAAEDEDDDEEEDDDLEPRMENLKIPTPHATNRIRMSPFAKETGEYLAASMAESGEVFIWDITQHYQWFNNPGKRVDKNKNRPAHTVKSHGNVEGYGLDWSPNHKTGALLTGDMDGRIFLTRRTERGWITDKTPFKASDNLQHRSVEDIQWSPKEETIFSTCGTDGHIRIWDTRAKESKRTSLLSVKASDTDVNVISWNRHNVNLLASGHDDGKWAVWDMRYFKSSPQDAVVASFDWHKQAITSIEFSPLEESAVVVGSEDSTVTLWDLSLEADDEEAKKEKEAAGLTGVPPQLLFLHWQNNVKEVHFNKHFPGSMIATGSDGFSIFKTISM